MKTPFKVTRYIVLFLIGIGLIAAMAVQYSHNIYEKIEEETSAIMKDNASKISHNLQVQFEQSRALMLGLAEFCTYDVNAYLREDFQLLMKRIEKECSFSHIGVVTPDGIVHYMEEQPFDASDTRWFERIMAGEEAYYIGEINQMRSIDWSMIIAIPIMAEGKANGCVIGEIRSGEFQKLASTDIFGEEACYYLLRQSGDVLAVENESYERTLNGIAASFSDFTSADVDAILQNMQSGKTYSDYFDKGGTLQYLYFAPIHWNGWYLLTVVPDMVLREKSNESVESALLFALAAGALVLLSFVTLFYSSWKAYRALQDAYNEVDSTYSAIPIAVFQFYLDPLLTIKRANDAFYRLIGCTREEYREQYKDKLSPLMSPPDIAAIEQYSTGIIRREFWIRGNDGTMKWVYGAFDLIRQEEHTLLQCTLTNTTVQKQELEEYKEFASRDALTGLKNRTAMHGEITQDLREGKNGILIMFDLDNFKKVNDTLGHPEGDRLLTQFSDLLRSSFDEQDVLGRLGGDEFAVYAPQCSSKTQAIDLLQALFSAFAERIDQKYHDCGLSVSAGGAFAHAQDSIDSLYEYADKALYYAKQKGKSMYCFYDEVEDEFSSRNPFRK